MASENIAIMFDYQGIGDILKNNSELHSAMEAHWAQILDEVRASFLETFGFDGNFEITDFTTDRMNAKIAAGDARTQKILKANPGWLGQFANIALD